MIRDSLVKLSQKRDLSEQEAYEAVLEILEGKTTPAQIGSYLSMLAYKGERSDEVVGSVRAMREKMEKVDTEGLEPIDVCGTGGDHKGTFNISTAASLVLAGGGVAVAKHGNRAASSQCGSAEVLDTLGVKLDAPSRILQECLKEAGIAFFFAPHFHPAMKNVGPYRKEIGIRTIFNILGPMSNPASVRRQVIGAFSDAVLPLIGDTLRRTGSERVIVLHSKDGLDEVSCAAETTICEYFPDQNPDHKAQATFSVKPEDFGLPRHPLSEIMGSDAPANARIIESILNGEKGPKRDAVVMNAAIGFCLANDMKQMDPKLLGSFRKKAEDSIDSGKALKALETLKKVSHQ
ncbi:MAG TPA: anthranilate phosphoribosyltransferase [bacterium]|nr:anthranilate phosphoribosyltransferase [bacterium]